jgi:hypothetical protein
MEHFADWFIEHPPWGEPHVFSVRPGPGKSEDLATIDREFKRDVYRVRTLKENARAIGCVMDFGAGIGAFAVACAQAFPDAEVYCFEADPLKFELLEENTKAFSKVHRFPYAVGYTPETMSIEEVFAHTGEEFVDLARWTPLSMSNTWRWIESHSSDRIDMMTGHYLTSFETFCRYAVAAFPNHAFPLPSPEDAGRFTAIMRGH